MKIRPGHLKLFAILPVAVLSIWCSPAVAQELPMEMMVTNRYANIRKGPGSGYDLVATLYRGDRLTAERKFQNWLRVLIPAGRIGWVREDLVGSYDPDQRDFTNEEADSLKALVDSRAQLIAELGDSTSQLLARIRTREARRDSLMTLLGVTEISMAPDSAAAAAASAQDSLAMIRRPKAVSPFEPQKSVTEARQGFLGRSTFSPRLGVLVFEGEAAAAGSFGYEMNFTREFSYRLDLTSGAFSPRIQGAAESSLNYTFATAGLVYSYEPGNLAVPFVEIGAGAARTSRGDSAATDLGLVFGAGFRLYFTPDFALEAGYRGNAVMSEGNDLVGLMYMGGGIRLPRHLPMMAPPWTGGIYLAPFAGYQMFSPRFSFNGAGVVGMRAGYQLFERLALEAEAGYLPLALNDGAAQVSLSAAQIGGRAVFYPWGSERGIFLQAGGGSLLLSGKGRPPSQTAGYAYLGYGAGASLIITDNATLGGEIGHQIFTDVARIVPEFEVGRASAVRISAGIDLKF